MESRSSGPVQTHASQHQVQTHPSPRRPPHPIRLCPTPYEPHPTARNVIFFRLGNRDAGKTITQLSIEVQVNTITHKIVQ